MNAFTQSNHVCPLFVVSEVWKCGYATTDFVSAVFINIAFSLFFSYVMQSVHAKKQFLTTTIWNREKTLNCFTEKEFLIPNLLFADAPPIAPIKKQQETKAAMLCCCQVSSVDSCIFDRNEFLPAVCKQQLVKTTRCWGHGRVSHQTFVSDSVLARRVSQDPLCFYGAWINNDCAVFSLEWQTCPPCGYIQKTQCGGTDQEATRDWCGWKES